MTLPVVDAFLELVLPARRRRVRRQRPPRRCCSSARSTATGTANAAAPSASGAPTALELWARGLERFTAERARHGPARFFDVDYDDFAAHPIRTVEAVYAHFGLALSPPARAAMEALRAHGAPAAVGPAHRYALSDFGLTGGQVGGRFAGYLR